MAGHVIGPVAEFPANTHRLVKIRQLEIGVFNVNGAFYALPNICPHQFGPLCEGRVNGTMTCNARTGWQYEWTRDSEILTCPWHGWEFDLTTGRALAHERVRVRIYPVTVENGQVVVTL